MKQFLIILTAGALLTGCMSTSESESQLPNYVTSQAYQGPAVRNDTYGGAAMPMRGLPR